MPKHRYKLTIEYLGSGLHGWQRQENGPSVQEELEKAFYAYCQEEVQVYGAGRTDAGVHATAMVAHVDLEKERDPREIMGAVNFHTKPQAIAITGAEAVPESFHARFSATHRRYLYRIINRQAKLAIDAGRAWHIRESLDAEAMHDAAQVLVGSHDFTSFRHSKCQARSPEKTLDLLEVKRVNDEVQIHTSARSFLHNQVRIMTGTLVHVGLGEWSKADVQAALEARDRTAGGITAPAHGLYLVEVGYDDE